MIKETPKKEKDPSPMRKAAGGNSEKPFVTDSEEGSQVNNLLATSFLAFEDKMTVTEGKGRIHSYVAVVNQHNGIQ